MGALLLAIAAVTIAVLASGQAVAEREQATKAAQAAAEREQVAQAAAQATETAWTEQTAVAQSMATTQAHETAWAARLDLKCHRDAGTDGYADAAAN